jgi:putative intracellular protease/amidase
VNPDFLRESRQARDFVRAFDGTSKPIATLGHGPWLLASAERVAPPDRPAGRPFLMPAARGGN